MPGKLTMNDWELKRLERQAKLKTPVGASATETLQLVAEVRKLRRALKPFANHVLGGYDVKSERVIRIVVNEGQVTRASMALEYDKVPT